MKILIAGPTILNAGWNDTNTNIDRFEVNSIDFQLLLLNKTFTESITRTLTVNNIFSMTFSFSHDSKFCVNRLQMNVKAMGLS